MSRFVIHNHLTRSVGRFRATAGVQDHGDCGCGCGGSGGCSHDRSEYPRAELGIDVTYIKGGYGRPKLTEHRHYSVSSVQVDPRGNAPSGAFVAGILRRLAGHKEMVTSGWTAEKAEGYYKKEQRDFGEVV
jgi:hypothetical protein